MHTRDEQMAAFGRVLDVLDTLREKCPWDKKQTNESLRPNTIEEVYELCDALLASDEQNICKELGDVLLHVCFYARIGSEKGQFDIADVCDKLVDKLIFRHPHVYHPSQVGAPEPKPLPYGEDSGEASTTDAKAAEASPNTTEGFRNATTSGEVVKNWEQIKLREKDGNKSVLAGVPQHLPSIIKAYRIQDKARNVGFDWQQPADVWQKVSEEISELRTELERGDKERSTRELGDVIFSIVNAARLYHLNPDTALCLTNEKFIRRFNYIEQHSIRQGRPLSEMTLEEMDTLWNEAKQALQSDKNVLQSDAQALQNPTEPA